MDRRAVVAFALGVGLLAGSGCTTLTKRNPFDAAANPKKGGSDKIAGSAPKASKQTFAPGTEDVLREPEFREFVEKELRDASPEERMAFMQTIQGKSPETARDILRARQVWRNSTARKKDAPITAPERTSRSATDANLHAAAWSAAKPELAMNAPPASQRKRSESTGHSLATVPAETRADSPTMMEAAAKTLPDEILVPNEFALQPGPPSRSATLPEEVASEALPTEMEPESIVIQAHGETSTLSSTLPVLENVVITPGNEEGVIHAIAEQQTTSDGPIVRSGAETQPSSPAIVPSTTATPLKPIARAPTEQPAIRPEANAPRVAPATEVGRLEFDTPGPTTPTSPPPQQPLAQQQDWRRTPEFLRLVDTVAQQTLSMKPPVEGPADDFIRQHAHLRMLYLMSGQSERAVESIPGIQPADQMFWQQTFWGMHNYFDSQNIPIADERAAQTVQQFTNAAQRLQEKASLKLRNVTFCQQISSYGSYERFPQLDFAPGQQVLLYAEVDNFHSEEIDNGRQFRTVLKSTVEIYRAGMPGDPQKVELPVPATEDISRNRRRDYFHTYEFVIPPRLQPGPHVLRLTVEDTLTKKIATATANFTVK